ncbi:MAG: RpiB/LacA/LacB family sugar-phosphate isomerase [Candidatus Wolfebacteria bacterium]|nr:RpiB/LacA/LacB family sugar-phosphate isomerase [Candidatus Wolfebacteria bacterium]
MIIYIGADHRGFNLKETLKKFIKEEIGYEVVDLGNEQLDENDDYPDFAMKVAKEVQSDSNTRRGILICGSGVGMDIAANKFKGIRSVLAINSDQVLLSRKDDDTNVLSLASDFINEESAKQVVNAWLRTPFSGEEKNKRRLVKISGLEN